MSKQLLIGLPSTGKTTFLAALWHVISSEEVDGSLHCEEYSDDIEYLERIRESWAECQQVSHTRTGSVKYAYFDLRDPATDRRTQLALPDVAGEIFEQQWGNRQWSNKFAEAADGASGILLFIHPEELGEPTLITEVHAPDFTGADGGTAPSGAAYRPQSSDWDPRDAPTQVKLVDLLQFLDAHLSCSRPLGLAIIVSAWDLVEDTPSPDISPKGWIEDRMPLLNQFIQSNPDIINTEVYGLSAQGGRLDEPDSVESLARIMPPSERIRVRQGQKYLDHDITEPVKWLMQLDAESK